MNDNLHSGYCHLVVVECSSPLYLWKMHQSWAGLSISTSTRCAGWDRHMASSEPMYLLPTGHLETRLLSSKKRNVSKVQVVWGTKLESGIIHVYRRVKRNRDKEKAQGTQSGGSGGTSLLQKEEGAYPTSFWSQGLEYCWWYWGHPLTPCLHLLCPLNPLLLHVTTLLLLIASPWYPHHPLTTSILSAMRHSTFHPLQAHFHISLLALIGVNWIMTLPMISQITWYQSHTIAPPNQFQQIRLGIIILLHLLQKCMLPNNFQMRAQPHWSKTFTDF